MKKKIRVAFDLDGVIIDKPPLIPKRVLERLFRGWGNKGGLHYRFPRTKLEILVRKLSHFYLLRPPIKKNINFIKKMAKNNDKKFELFLISARYSFLLPETKRWFIKRDINGLFKNIYFNEADEQPHLFKERVLQEIQPDIFIDDDREIVSYLRVRLNKIRLYFYQKSSTHLLEQLLDLDLK